MLTQDTLKKLMSYEPMTGLFLSNRNTNFKKVGDPVGYIDDRGYRRFAIAGKRYRMHQLAFLYMTGEFPEDGVDHINRDKLDNRWENLREADQHTNMKNCKTSSNNTSGISGVHWMKTENKWRVRIGHKGGRLSAGLFEDFFEACCIRKSLENSLSYTSCN